MRGIYAMPDDVGLFDALLPSEGMADKLQFPHDHAEIAWSHFLAQHIGKVNTEIKGWKDTWEN